MEELIGRKDKKERERENNNERWTAREGEKKGHRQREIERGTVREGHKE